MYCHDFSTDSACSTHSQYLLFLRPGDTSSERLGVVYQTFIQLDIVYSDFIQENIITTKHGFSLNSNLFIYQARESLAWQINKLS